MGTRGGIIEASCTGERTVFITWLHGRPYSIINRKSLTRKAGACRLYETETYASVDCNTYLILRCNYHEPSGKSTQEIYNIFQYDSLNRVLYKARRLLPGCRPY